MGIGLIYSCAFRNLIFEPQKTNFYPSASIFYEHIFKNIKHILKNRITLNASLGICGESIVLLIVLYKEFLLESDYKGLLKESPRRSGSEQKKILYARYFTKKLKLYSIFFPSDALE